ncbi:hypothetical protein EVJ50_03250 [Synechococcus sp. RSCCF101]|uniref:Ycf51 family protein n=1 Tax=Synechococcus sp. RSCCF101 TaxID=2511069 RepID=UPI0012478215|nr:Ycf51 family protein [Synechococcus sp. RSCCF101]QEY31414.1 hypothetical protein EVJ50_03250 [Synechococcus sp. RSCCF101]
MPPVSLLLQAGLWLGVAGAALTVLTVVAFLARWGPRFRLVGISSFTVLLAIFCWAFAISYVPRQSVEGALTVPIVFDNGSNLVVAAYPADAPSEAVLPTLQQLALNLRPQGRTSEDGVIHIRLRRLDAAADGASRPVVLAEATRDLTSGELQLEP